MRKYIFLALPFLLGGSLSVYAQHVHSSGEPVTVDEIADGSKTPESISDLTAYLHFFLVLADQPNFSAADNDSRRQSYLKFFFSKRCGDHRKEDRTLTKSQSGRLILIAAGLSSRLNALQSEAAALAEVYQTKWR